MEGINPSNLLGKRIDNYTLEEIIYETEKNLAFKGRHNSLGKEYFLKILKPGQSEQRQKQFLDEGKTLIKLGHPENLPEVHYAGESNGLMYLAMDWLNGPNLYDLIKSGRKFSFNEFIEIIYGASNGLANMHKVKVVHGDIKLKNILRIHEGKTYLVDFGGQISHKGNYQGDLKALADTFVTISRYTDKPLPKKLEDLLSKWSKSPSEHPAHKIREEILSFKKVITRRKFLKIAGTSTLVLSGAGSFIYKIYKKNQYEKSIEIIREAIAKTDIAEGNRLEELFKELKFRISDQKIRWLEQKKIPKDKFPYATTNDGNWFKMGKPFWTDGFWPAILLEAYDSTKDNFFLDSALQRIKNINFSVEDSFRDSSVKFFYSHAKAYEITKNPKYKEITLEALENFVKKFDKETGIIKLSSTNECEPLINAHIIPFLLWGYRTTSEPIYLDIALNHTINSARLIVRSDGSVRKTAIFNSKRELIGERNSKGISDSSTLSRSQAQMFFGLSEFFITKNEPWILKQAERSGNYFIDNLPEDYVNYFDFAADPKSKPPRDTSAAALALSGLRNLYSSTQNSIYLRIYERIRKSLAVKYLEVRIAEFKEGLLREGCENWKRKEYINNSLIVGDYFFLKNLK